MILNINLKEATNLIFSSDSIEFKQKDTYSNSTSSDLKVSGKSGDVLEHWVELTPQVLANDKRLTEEYKKKIKKARGR